MPHFVLDARTATAHYPGIGRYVRSLAAAMVGQLQTGERLTLLVDPAAPLEIRALPAVPIAASPFSVSQQWAIPDVLKHLRADLYHSPYYLMPYRPGVATLLTVYDVIPLRHPEYSSTRARLLFRVATRLALRAARSVIAITETARRDFMDEFGVAAARITAIPLAADDRFNPPGAAELQRVRDKYGLPQRYALYLGSNKPHKNLLGLVRAWCTLPDRGGAVLVLAGAWDPRHSEARAAIQGPVAETVVWLGLVPDADLPALYGGAEVFVFPSLFEGFGLPVLEAMASGAPVVCSNVTALPEVAGEAAVLFDPARQQDLVSALDRVLHDPPLRDSLRARGLARAARFSWQSTAERTLDLYRHTPEMTR